MLKWVFIFGVSSLIACGNCDRLIDLKELATAPKHELPSEILDKHLVLNFDVNGTLIGFDSAKGMERETYLKRLMTNEIILGDEEICYNDWVYREYPNDREKREALFLGMGDLISDEHYNPQYDELVGVMADRLERSALFESFYVLIDALQEEGVSFTLNLRTFGHDLTEVCQEIEKHTGIVFNERVKVEGESWVLSDGTVLDHPRDIATLLQEKNCLVQDDYEYWSKHDRKRGYGKLFPISKDPNVVEVFFDDNVTVDLEGEESILVPMSLSGTKLSEEDAPGMIDVNTAEAILDSNYFIDRLDKCR